MIKIIKPPIFYFLLVASSFIMLITSCELLKKDPVYEGTWQFTENITADNIIYNTIRTLKLTRNIYEETYVIKRENSATISAIIGTRGSLGLTHTNLVFTLEELGSCELDESEMCTGNVQWYGDGTQYWLDNIPYFSVKVAGEFEVDETTLWLKRDLNKDGDIEDAGEDITFQMI
jgi:hypothetical protein